MKPGYELTEHTADVGIRAWADDLDDLFAEAARGLFAVIVDPRTVSGRLIRPVQLEADSMESLLHTWLDELNALHQTHGEVYCGFTVSIVEHVLVAHIEGEPLDAARHDLRVEVKAVTWHDLQVTQTDDGYAAFVLLDI